MVVDELTPDEVDRLFHALADRTRRDIVVRVIGGERSVSELARGYEMSFAAVQKHVAVLERAGLVTKVRRGREALVRPDITAVQRAQRLLREYEELWLGRVARMDALLDEPR
ncbi:MULTISPECIES: ArsR/SmtB family transcription factor [Tsukamurella]|uniref:Metalloregulator ArsR/SmtB family transcription factor n=1 Tax=Tsukamurella strandjordii TaxID=147577 RepID=A0AA90SKE4_9ACTN|nr:MULTISPECIES: metalloregulator ArsR/SmtB family transcription factor [Tsukamurella]MDP0396952.1 metalloregulator ArsR/SmtB family transcription factor [Tsukamurella strandjordii]